MARTYIDKLTLTSDDRELSYILGQKRTCYNGIYPFKLFPQKGLKELEFEPVTIFYGGNGSGKSTLLNIIAEKTGVIRHSAFSSSAFFKDYVSMCRVSGKSIPENSQILTSDDVSDYLLNMRYLNDGIEARKDALFEEYMQRKYSSHRLQSLSEYDDWKESYDAKSKSQSQFVRDRLMRNVDMYSNGESAMRYFTDRITENALYLLDEPENSLSISLIQDLAKYIAASARHFGCQFIIATHSPLLLAMEGACVYDLDSSPVEIKNWWELGNVKLYYDFFNRHRQLFEL